MFLVEIRGWVTGHSKRYASSPNKTGRFGQDQCQGAPEAGRLILNDTCGDSEGTLNVDVHVDVGEINLEVV
jgi:hypothetical protein